MKKSITSVTLRGGIATALCISIILYPQLRVSAAGAASAGAATRAAADLKTESQFRSEASRYDGAIRVISGIVTMKLETADDLKKAFAILDRERPNLKLHLSKLVVLALSDSNYTSAIKKKAPDKLAAEAFAKELAADRKVLLKLDGAGALVTRMRRSFEADVATLRRVAERLKEVAEKIKKASQGTTSPGDGTADGFRLVRAGFSEGKQPTATPNPLVMSSQGGPAEVLLVVGLFYAAVIVSILLYAFVANFGTEQDKDQVADCQQETDSRYSSCVSEARDLPSGLPFFLSEVAEAGCYADWLLRQAACLTLYT